MLWRDFEPYVLPEVMGCPIPVMEHHARLMAQEFCKKTLCFTRTLPAIIAPGDTGNIVMEPEPGTQIIKVKAATLNGNTLTLATTAGRDHTAYTEDNRVLVMTTPPPAGAAIVITASLAPTLRAQGLDNDIAAQYLQDIAHGVVAAIKRLKDQPFTDPKGAIEKEAMYRARITTVAAKIMRGQLGAKMPSYGSFL